MGAVHLHKPQQEWVKPYSRQWLERYPGVMCSLSAYDGPFEKYNRAIREIIDDWNTEEKSARSAYKSILKEEIARLGLVEAQNQLFIRRSKLNNAAEQMWSAIEAAYNKMQSRASGIYEKAIEEARQEARKVIFENPSSPIAKNPHVLEFAGISPS